MSRLHLACVLFTASLHIIHNDRIAGPPHDTILLLFLVFCDKTCNLSHFFNNKLCPQS